MSTKTQIEGWAHMLDECMGAVDENKKFRSDAEAEAAVREFMDLTRRNQGAYALAFRLAENSEEAPTIWGNDQLRHRAGAEGGGMAALARATHPYGRTFRAGANGLVYNDKTEIAGRRAVIVGIVRDKPAVALSDYAYAYFFEAGPGFNFTEDFFRQLDTLKFGADRHYGMPTEPALKNPLGYMSSDFHFNDKEFEFFMKAHAWRFEKALRSVSYADAFLLAKAVDAVMERLRACRRDSWSRKAAARDDFEDQRNEARGRNAYKLRLQRFFDAGLFEPVVFEDMMEDGECPRAVLRLAAMSQGYYAVGRPDGEDDEYASMVSDMKANADEAAGESDTYFDDYVAEELDVAEIFQEALKKLILDGGVKRPEDFKKCVDGAWKAWEDTMKDEYRHYRRQAYGD